MEKMIMGNKALSKWVYKNWERHNRIMLLLHAKRLTITELSHEIGELIQTVSPCIWGIPGRRTRRIEEKIASFFCVTRDELFGDKPL